MKKLIIALLAMTLLLTAFVACGGDDTDNASSTDKEVQAVKPNGSSSVQSLTSEEMDAWGDVSIGFESGDSTYGDGTASNGGGTSSDSTVTSNSASEPTDSTDSTTSTGNSATSTNSSATSSKNNNSVSSNPKDQGFGPWIPIP